MTLKCLSCGGTYQAVQSDGTLYFHACPDIPNPAATPAALLLDPSIPLTLPHPKRRDENVVIDPVTRIVSIKSPGLGVTVV